MLDFQPLWSKLERGSVPWYRLLKAIWSWEPDGWPTGLSNWLLHDTIINISTIRHIRCRHVTRKLKHHSFFVFVAQSKKFRCDISSLLTRFRAYKDYWAKFYEKVRQQENLKRPSDDLCRERKWKLNHDQSVRPKRTCFKLDRRIRSVSLKSTSKQPANWRFESFRDGCIIDGSLASLVS